jgi:hypothetical protein
VHRLRCVRRRVPERLRRALRGSQAHPPRSLASGATRASAPREGTGDRRGPRAIRRLHPPRRMRGRVSQGHRPRRHRADEPGVPARHARRWSRDT